MTLVEDPLKLSFGYTVTPFQNLVQSQILRDDLTLQHHTLWIISVLKIVIVDSGLIENVFGVQLSQITHIHGLLLRAVVVDLVSLVIKVDIEALVLLVSVFFHLPFD